MSIISWMLRSTRKVSRIIGNPLEWRSSAKAMLLGAVTAIVYLHYGLWVDLLLSTGNDYDWFDLEYLAEVLPIFYGLSLLSSVLTLVAWYVSRRMGESSLLEYIAALYFALSLCYFSYQIGTMSLPVGAVWVGAPVVGFIFYNRGAVMLAFSLAISIQVLLSFGAAWGWWPYAPVFQERAGLIVAPSAAVIFHLYLYTLPHMFLLLLIAYVVLRRWRNREAKVRLLSITDPLTGLLNRRSILAHLEQERERSCRKGPVLSVLMVDLDNFKAINDQRGHEAGDYALIAAAGALQHCLRQNDRLGRYGGEEFLIVLPGTDLEGAHILAERCRQQLANTDVMLEDGGQFRITGSFGLVCNEGDVHMGVDELLRRADQAMYQAKNAGRNRVLLAE